MTQAILSVEAVAHFRRARGEVLCAAGFEILEAANGSDALRLASENQPALAVLAIDLPEMDGLEICRRLKADPRTAAIPVLHIDGPGLPYGRYAQSLASGAQAYLQEPVAPAILTGVATALIRARSDAATAAEQDAVAKDRLSALIDGIPDEVWFADAQGRFTLANPAALREFKIDAPTQLEVEAMAKSLEIYRADGSLRPPEEAPPLRALRGEIVQEQEEIVRTPASGALRYRQTSAAPVKDAAGNIIGSVSVVRDITARKQAEETLRAAQERNRFLANMLDHADQPFAIGYPDGSLGYLNSAFERLTGYTREELQAIDWSATLTPPEWRALESAHLEELHRTRRPVRYEKEYLRKDGTRVPIELLVHLSTGERGQPLYYSFLTDLTERRQAQEALRRQGEWLRVTLSSIGDAVLAAGIDGTIAFLNPVAERLTGWTQEQALGHPAQDVFRTLNEQTREPAEDIVASVLRGGRPVTLANHTALVTRDGREIPIEDSAAPILDAAGSVIGVVLVFHDVAGKRRAEEALREERARLTLALDVAHAGIWEWDLRTNLSVWSEELWKVYGLEPHSCQPSYEAWREVVHPDDRPSAEQIVQEAARNGTEMRLEFRVQDPDGTVRWLLSLGRPLRDADGHLARFVGIAVDFTAIKKAEQALRVSEARYRNLFETVNEGFALCEIVCDESGKPRDYRHLAVNPAFERQTGVTAEYILTHTSRETFPQAEPVWLERYSRVALTGEPAHFEEWFGAAGRWFQVSAFQTEPGRFGAVFSDVTARKRAEEERQRLAAELADRVEELQAILDAAPVAIWIAHDPQGLRITGNAFTDRIVTPPERGANISLSPPPGAAPLPYKVCRNGVELRPEGLPAHIAATTGRPVGQQEMDLVFPDGRVANLLMSAVPLFDTHGQVRGAIAAGADITSRRQAEQALRENEAVLRGFFDSAGVMRGFVDLVDGAITHVSCNTAAAELNGVDRDSIAGQTARQTGASEEVVRAWTALYEESRLTGSPVSMEYARPGAPGQDRWMHGTAAYLGTGPSGHPRFAYTLLDLTARKRAEEALRESEERLRLAQISAGVGVWEWNPRADTLYLTPEFEQLYGLPPGTIKTAEDWRPLIYPDDLARVEATRDTAVANHEPFEMEFRILHASGEIRWLSGNGAAVYDDSGETVRILGVNVDITARKLAEGRLRESELQLRTLGDNLPLGAIYRYRVDAGGRHHVDFISAGIERLTGVPAAEFMNDAATVARYTVPEDRDKLAAAIDLSRDSLTRFEVELRHTHRVTGELRCSLLRSTPTRLPDGSTVWDGIELDITERKRVEEALRESEERFRIMADGCPTLIWVTDAEGKQRFVNRTYLEFFGTTFEQLRGSGWQPRVHPDDAPAYVEAVRCAVRDRAPFHAEARVRNGDGEWRWVASYAEPRCSAGGEFLGHVGITLDVTESRRAQEALRESRATLQAALHSMADAVFISDAEGRFIEFNDAFATFYRFPSKEECFRTFAELHGSLEVLLPDGTPAPRDMWAVPRALRGESAANVEFTLRRKDTGETWIGSYSFGPIRDKSGAIVGSVVVARDITEIKRAEEALRRQAALLDLSYDAVVVRTEQDRITFWNQGAQETYGWTAQEAMGQVIHDFLQTRSPKPLSEIAAQASATGRWEGELVHTCKDGRQVTVITRWAVQRDPDGRPIGILEINRDITERKQAEERLRDAQKLESLGLLAGGVAHDFNNLLVGVIGNASLAQEMLPPNDPASELLDGVIKTGEQAAHLTRQMLAYSGKGKFVVESLDLSALIPEISGLVRPSISKKIALHFDLAAGLPPIEADRGQVQQVFMNLVLNAAEAIGSHDGLISIRTGVEDVDRRYSHRHPEAAELQPGRYAYLEVRDTGCGMDEATRAKIFDPFFSTKFTGRGLGLAAVSGILRGHHGAIVVTSAPGKGSCFTVLFPAAAPRGARSARTAPGEATLRGTGVILVVDDEPLVRQMAKMALERHGYTVLVAESGPAAIDIFRRFPGRIALVVLDLSMPQMSGEETLPELNKVRPGVKVVVSSGYSEAEAMNLFRGQRVVGFIQKPYNSKGLAEKVKVYLG